MRKKCFLIVCSVIVLIAIYFPSRHARRYSFIHLEDIYNELMFTNIDSGSNLKTCDYYNIIIHNTEIEINSIYETKQYDKPNKGGEFLPKNCNAQMKIALIVPYRDRSQQLNIFLNYMHNFLQKQNLFYRIFIVNQNDSLPFNRAKMLNYGAKEAIRMGYPCLILHDVDLIPLNTGNIYGCTQTPRHMSSSLDSFRFNLPYLTLFGGAVAIQSEQYQQINGMSNEFYGWGGEDDDFYQRLEIHKLLPDRFSPHISKYTMLMHKKEKPSSFRWSDLKYSIERHKRDGITSLPNNYTVKLEDLFTTVVAS